MIYMVFKKKVEEIEKKSIQEILKEELKSLNKEERQILKFLHKKNNLKPLPVQDW